MNLTEKNGQPSMEEILASIRRIIADEPQGANPVIDLRAARPQASMQTIDDSHDFELPAIFRPSPPTPEKPAPLFGRLTDALRSASAGPAGEVRALRGGENGASVDPYLSPLPSSPVWPSANGAHATQNDQLSGLTSPRLEARPAAPAVVQAVASASAVEHVPQPHPQHTAYEPTQEPSPAPAAAQASSGWLASFTNSASAMTSPPATASSSGTDDVKRVMVPFRDTRMARLGAVQPFQPAAAASPEEPPQAFEPTPVEPPPGVDFSAIIPGHFERDGVEPAPVEATDWATPSVATPASAPIYAAAAEMSAYPLLHEVPLPVEAPARAAPPVPVAESLPPPSAASAADRGAAQPVGTIEDTTADLLRPMLRQWLAENMPRMVEKALHIEVAESVKLTRKPPAN
ncbi:MAG: DUF2497 domain-containing protein [Hyphomicrobium sp.]